MTSVTAPENTVVEAEGRSQTVLGRYRLLSRLGSGGFGVVWKAFDEKLGRAVAVKEISTSGVAERRSRRADREAYAVARLSHPAIVSLYEQGSEFDATYLVSELIYGQTLDAALAEGSLSEREIAYIGIDLCHALDHAHRAGVIHRDVKPQNVMVPAENNQVHAKLMDFGVAHLTCGERLTGTGDVVGTLMYMAPEQARGEKITAAVDVYSLALTLYEAWAGASPLSANTPGVALDRIGKRLPSIGRRCRDLPRDVAEIIDAGLDPDPEKRPQLMELSEALDRSIGDFDESLQQRPKHSKSGILYGLRSETGLGLIGRVAFALLVAVFAAAAAVTGRLGAGEIATVTVFAALMGFVLPRISWIFAAVVASVLVAGRFGSGAMLVLILALAPIPLLLPRHGRLWPLPAVSIPLGAVGLGPAFLLLTSGIRSGFSRASTAAIASWWLALTEIVSGSTLYLGPPKGVWSFERFQGSIFNTLEHGIAPLIAGPAVAVAALWALFALTLPYCVGRRRPMLDIAGALIWSVSLVMASRAIGELLGGGVGPAEPKGTVITALAAVVAVGTFHIVRQARAT